MPLPGFVIIAEFELKIVIVKFFLMSIIHSENPVWMFFDWEHLLKSLDFVKVSQLQPILNKHAKSITSHLKNHHNH